MSIIQTGAMSIIQMGEELIGHPTTAINELVKNSYDADADKCWIYTEYNDIVDDSFLILKDNGLGMNYETLFGDWLQPSKSIKRQLNDSEKRSEIYHRKFLGSKGIGRLAAMALGRYLTVISKQDDENEYNWITIDREQFRVESLLNNIEFPGGEISELTNLFNDNYFLEERNTEYNHRLKELINSSLFSNFNEGTTIVIQQLDESFNKLIRDEFNEKDDLSQTSIFKSLRDLITPLQLNSKIQDDLLEKNIIDSKLKIDNGESVFELFYDINLLEKSTKKMFDFFKIEPSDIIENFDYRIFGKTFKDGSVKGQYICKRLENDSYQKLFDLTPEYTLSKGRKNSIDSEQARSGVGEFYFDIRIYDLDSDAKDKMVQILNASGRREANKTFSRYLGLRISKNGFRVKPYGNENYDWMGLGAKRVQKHIYSIGPNQIIGNIFLNSPQNDSLKEKTNREGFYENKEFTNFKEIISGILEEAGRERGKYRLKNNLGRKINNKHERPETDRFIQYILKKTDDEDIISKSKEFIEETNSSLDNMEGSLSFAQRLASLGSGLELVYHELSQPISVLGSVKSSLRINANKINEKKLNAIFLDRLDNMEGAIKMLDELKNSLKPAIGKSLPKKFNPKITFEKVCYLFENTIKELNIKVEVKKESFEIKSFEYVFWVSFLNILNNAVYWLKFVEERILIFETNNDEIIISNTGPKIPENDLDVIFEYGITAKKEKNSTGLGLAFTKNMLSANGWDIYSKNKSFGPGFHIKKQNN